MNLRDELQDPWGLLLAGLVAGGAWALAVVPVGAAVGLGAVVYGLKVGLGALSGRERPRRPFLLPVRGRSPEERWLKRGEKAVRTFRQLSSSARAGPVAERVAAVGEKIGTTMDAMRRLAGQTSAVAGALDRVDAERLAADRVRLESDIERARLEEVKVELRESLESVEAQIQVYRRLDQASKTLLARIESGAIGLEALVARLAEVIAMTATATAGEGDLDRIDELAVELDGLRSGLQETEDLSKRALSAYQSQEGV